MNKIVLLSCGKGKLSQRTNAGEMYTGNLFTKSRRYAEKKLNPDKLFILSAKYGLLRQDEVIEPYDMTLNDMGVAAKRQWADKVLRQLGSHTDLDNDYFVFLAGKNYRDQLISHIMHYCVPMKGLRIGKQLAWLNRQIYEQ